MGDMEVVGSGARHFDKGARKIAGMKPLPFPGTPMAKPTKKTRQIKGK
jgi:hypothetical protein